MSEPITIGMVLWVGGGALAIGIVLFIIVSILVAIGEGFKH